MADGVRYPFGIYMMLTFLPDYAINKGPTQMARFQAWLLSDEQVTQEKVFAWIWSWLPGGKQKIPESEFAKQSQILSRSFEGDVHWEDHEIQNAAQNNPAQMELFIDKLKHRVLNPEMPVDYRLKLMRKLERIIKALDGNHTKLSVDLAELAFDPHDKICAAYLNMLSIGLGVGKKIIQWADRRSIIKIFTDQLERHHPDPQISVPDLLTRPRTTWQWRQARIRFNRGLDGLFHLMSFMTLEEANWTLRQLADIMPPSKLDAAFFERVDEKFPAGLIDISEIFANRDTQVSQQEGIKGSFKPPYLESLPEEDRYRSVRMRMHELRSTRAVGRFFVEFAQALTTLTPDRQLHAIFHFAQVVVAENPKYDVDAIVTHFRTEGEERIIDHETGRLKVNVFGTIPVSETLASIGYHKTTTVDADFVNTPYFAYDLNSQDKREYLARLIVNVINDPHHAQLAEIHAALIDSNGNLRANVKTLMQADRVFAYAVKKQLEAFEAEQGSELEGFCNAVVEGIARASSSKAAESERLPQEGRIAASSDVDLQWTLLSYGSAA